jgi:hypothetical protein
VSRRLVLALAVALAAAAAGLYALVGSGGSSGPSSPPAPDSTSAQTAAPPTGVTTPGGRRAARSDWPVFGHDPSRSNVAPAATGIDAAKVAGLHRRVVQLPGTVDSSPIYLHDVQIGGRRRSAFFMTTTYGRTLALSPAGRVLWTFTPGSYATYAGTAQITTATPAADPGRRYLYAVSPDGLVHKLAVATGREVEAGAWPVRVTLLPAREKISSALNVWRGRLYVATGGYFGDAPPYQGHVVVIAASSGRIEAVANTLCSDVHHLLQPAACPPSGSAVWGRAGAVVDPSGGDILVTTGNADFDGRTSWGDSVLALSPSAGTILHSYTPSDQAELSSGDLDLGSSAPALLRSRRLVVAQGGKDGVLRLVALAGRRPGAIGGELQELPTPGGAPLFTAPAVWRSAPGGELMFCADGSGTAAYRLRGAGASARLVRVWANPTAGTSPVLAGGLLYVYDPNGALDVYDPSAGRLLASLAAGAGHWSSPIVAAGVVALPVGDANDHATRGQIDLYSK